MKKYRLLMLTTLIISGCSICYELIISAVSSYLMGDSVWQYSVTIGLYMSAMGLGSYLSKYIKKNLFNWFAFIEMGVGIAGGTSALILFYANLYLETYQIVMYLEIILIGTFVGVEIPLLTRIVEEDNENLRVTLSSIFSFDYIGGLVGSIAFPLILLPRLGYFATAFFTGCMNVTAAALIIFRYAKRLHRPKLYKAAVSGLLFLMVLGMLFSDTISGQVEDGLYRDRVILSEHTKYQHIVMTKHKDDLRLYLDGNVQFCSLDEYRYHEALVHIPMAQAPSRDKVLVLGGGDGLALRELLKYPETEITLVDLDEQMVQLCTEDPQIAALNEGALESDRVTVICQDAYQYLTETEERYDVILVDLPDPNNESLNKLYTNIFYRLCFRALTDEGIMSVQSTSPYYATKAYWCIGETLKSEGFYVKPYHLQVPSFGDWGFQLASKQPLEGALEISVPTRYLTEENADNLFVFGKDELPEEKPEINALSKPVLMEYYSEAVRNWE